LRRVKLKDVCLDITVGHVGPMADQYVDYGIPFLRSQNVAPFRIDFGNLKFISEAFHRKLKKSALSPGDVVVVRTGYPGTASVIPQSVKVANCADLVVIRPSAEINGHFLACIFNSAWGRGTVSGSLVGVAQQHFNIGVAREMEITLPPVQVQDRIASILSAYDDLIENNTRRIKILEDMAQMLYREWFVNFRFPGHEKVRMVDSELGPIPDGWAAQPLEELLGHVIGGGWGEDEPSEKSTVPAYVIRGTDIPGARTGSVEKCPLRWHKESNFRSRKLEAGDLVFEVSGGSKGQPVGRSLLVGKTLLGQFNKDVICASFCKLLRPKTNIRVSEALYLFLTEAYSNGTIEKYQVQSTGISNFKFTEFIADVRMPLPPEVLMRRFQEIVSPIVDLMAVLGEKNSNLRTTRDFLLPKLISGEIPVEAAEETAAELMEEVAQPA
jgi:type I restriction enzyme, S subunit